MDIQVDNRKGQEVDDSSTTVKKSQSIFSCTRTQHEGGWIISEVTMHKPARLLHVPGNDGDCFILIDTQDGEMLLLSCPGQGGRGTTVSPIA
jgi:hypothetical protein